MGIEYCLVKEETKEFFDLGKGSWASVFETTEMFITDFFKTEFSLYEVLLGKVAYTFQEDTPIGYFQKLAKEIIRWAGASKIVLRSDAYFDDDAKKEYRETGSRFGLNCIKFYLVGQHLEVTEEQIHTWGLIGIFGTEELAIKNCSDEWSFYVPIILNKVKSEFKLFEGMIYPLKE